MWVLLKTRVRTEKYNKYNYLVPLIHDTLTLSIYYVLVKNDLQC